MLNNVKSARCRRSSSAVELLGEKCHFALWLPEAGCSSISCARRALLQRSPRSPQRTCEFHDSANQLQRGWRTEPKSSARTAFLVGSSTQSMRRSTVKGRMTFPYSCGLYLPLRRSATDQRKAERFIHYGKTFIVCLSSPRSLAVLLALCSSPGSRGS